PGTATGWTACGGRPSSAFSCDREPSRASRRSSARAASPTSWCSRLSATSTSATGWPSTRRSPSATSTPPRCCPSTRRRCRGRAGPPPPDIKLFWHLHGTARLLPGGEAAGDMGDGFQAHLLNDLRGKRGTPAGSAVENELLVFGENGLVI